MQKDLHMLQDNSWMCKAEEVQFNADMDKSKQFFGVVKAVYGPLKPNTTTLHSSDGTILLKDKSSITDRWREHFANLQQILHC